MAEPILETQLVAARPGGEATLARTPITVGEILAKTLRVWWRHVLAFTAMSVVVYAPLGAAAAVLLGAAWLGFQGREGQAAAFGLTAFAAVLATVVLAVVQAGAVTYGTVRFLAGEQARLGQMVRVGFARGLPIVGVGLLLSAGVAVGMLLLLVPGIALAVATCVAVPAAVVERPGVLGAIRRSFALTRGHRWSLLAAGLAVLAVVWVLAAAVQVAATLLASALLPQEQALVGTLVASQLGNAFFSALPLVGVAVAYHELRVAKEGLDTAALARVFE